MAERIALNIRERHSLVELVLKEWAKKRINSKEFAAYATQALGFDLNSNHVEGILEAFEIPRVHTPATFDGAVVEALERRIKALETRLEIYFGPGVKS